MGLFDKAAYEAAPVSNGGEYPRMGAGAYIVQIQAVRTHGEDGNNRPINYVTEKNYVKLIYDVVEGEHAGRFSDDFWRGEDKDYAHCFYLSWKNLGAFKGCAQAIDESNPGFDTFAAADAEQWGLFIGKRFGIVVGEEEYIANDGNVKTRLTFPRMKSVQDIHNGKYKVPPLKKLDSAASSTPAASGGQMEQVPTDVYDDIPFAV